MAPEFSVVVPTYNRLDVLPEVLDALEGQRDAPSFELVIVNDGASDGTTAFLDQRSFKVPAKVLHQANAGPAAARNAGVAAAAGRWVAFLGDDTVPQIGWLAAHRAAHRRFDDDPLLAVIGYTRWHPRMRLNPFLRYINEYGLQFGYALIDKPDQVPFNFFYTSNLSLHRELLVAEPFDERFPYAAWEDIETSYRLSQRHGMRLVYEAQAVTHHDHPTSLQRFAQRQEKAGYSAVVFYGLHNELGGFLGLGTDGPPPLPPRGWPGLPSTAKRTLAHSLQKLLIPVALPSLWESLLREDYIRGLHRGWQDKAYDIE